MSTQADALRTRPLYIFDLDGTLANHRHRLPFLDGQDQDRWRKFFKACVDDEPMARSIALLGILREHAEVWIFTGRSEMVRAETVAWLVAHTSYREHELETALVMRGIGDHRPDDALKCEWFQGMLVEDRERLAAVFEDRDRVAGMWRACGIPCYQVAPGDF